MKKIVITGGCGFIGVNLIRFLLTNDEEISIRILDNLSVGQPEDLARVCKFNRWKDDNPSQWKAGGVFLVTGDIRDFDLSLQVCQGADVIVHLAANTGVIPSIEDPRKDCELNVLGTFNYLESARQQGVARFILASSGAPLGEQIPPIHEEMVPRPISPYGASKLCGEAYCSAFHGSYGLETVCLRFGNVYGPYSYHKGSVVAKFIKHLLADEPLPIYGDGNQTRDFIYVDDLARAVWLSMSAPDIGGQVFQIATHREHTVAEVAEMLNELARNLLGKKGLIIHENARKGEVLRNFSDIGKAKKLLGWEPRWNLSQGLENTFKWFVEQKG